MKHLSMKEIRAFIALDSLESEDLEIAERVNGHIRCCKECAMAVKAGLAVYDKFSNFTAVELALKDVYTLDEQSEETQR